MRDGHRIEWATLLMAAITALLAAIALEPDRGGQRWYLVVVIAVASIFASWALVGLLAGTYLRSAVNRRMGRASPEASHEIREDGSVLLKLDLKHEHLKGDDVYVEILIPGVEGWVDHHHQTGASANVQVVFPKEFEATSNWSPSSGPLASGKYIVHWTAPVGAPAAYPVVAEDKFRIR